MSGRGTTTLTVGLLVFSASAFGELIFRDNFQLKDPSEVICLQEQTPEYASCDDGIAQTFPDLCRSNFCIGAVQGSLSTGPGNFQPADVALATGGALVMLNETLADELHLFLASTPFSNTFVGKTVGIGRRLHTLGSRIYIAGERLANTSGGLNCIFGSAGPCPLLGVLEETGIVTFNGQPIHQALNGLNLSGFHDIAHFFDAEPVICQSPPCYSDLHWWFVGQARGLAARPSVVHCLEENPTTISCRSLSSNYNTSTFDVAAFVSAEVSVFGSGSLIDPEYNSGLFGIRQAFGSSVHLDIDKNPLDNLSTTLEGQFNLDLVGSFRRSCVSVIEYGGGGALSCSASNLAGFGHCEADTDWDCARILLGNNFHHGAVAGRSVLVTPTSLFVHVSGSVADDSNWTEIDFGLEPGVTLGAVGGDSDQWWVFANNSATGQVTTYRFLWP